MNESNSNGNAQLSSTPKRRVFKLKGILVDSDLLNQFKTGTSCNVVLITDDGKR